MPELAEVEFFRKQWDPGLNRKIIGIHLHAQKRIFRGVPIQSLKRSISGKILLSSQTHGKQMLFRLGQNGWLGIHLGMTGKLSAKPADYQPGPHDHLVLRTRGSSLVFSDPRIFGRIRFHYAHHPPDWWTRLPPSPLSTDFDLPRMADICRRRGRTSLKALLLRQDCFPGIGNWMADEILWQTRLHPNTHGKSLSPLQIRGLYASIRKICREAMRIIGKDWSDPPESWLFLHRWKAGGKCPRCRKILTRGLVGGRTTCWCPSCQPPLPRRGRPA